MTTFDNKDEAKEVARSIIDEGLGACVQVIGPIESVYKWKGHTEVSEEYICLIKTKNSLYKDLKRTIIELHPYENPEILQIDIQDGSHEYLKWIDDVTI